MSDNREWGNAHRYMKKNFQANLTMPEYRKVVSAKKKLNVKTDRELLNIFCDMLLLDANQQTHTQDEDQ